MSIRLIYTGGTIGACRNGAKALGKSHALNGFTRLLKRRLVRLGLRSFPLVEAAVGKLSENMEPADWSTLARLIDRRIREGASGIVVAHGTDTLIYTACALFWMLEGAPVPVVLTGSLMPLEARGSDAPANLAFAMKTAAEAGKPGVRICFGGLELDPRNVKKEAFRKDCFQPVWSRVAKSFPVNPASGKPTFEVRPDVMLFTLYPGFKPEWILQAARKGVKGIVLAGYGTGTACAVPGPYDLRKAVKEAAGRGVVVWLVSQHAGWVAPDYDSTVSLVRAGARLMPGWTPEAAVTWLMCRLDAEPPAGYREATDRRGDTA